MGILYFISKPFEKNGQKRFTFLKVWREISLTWIINISDQFFASFIPLVWCKNFS